MLRLTTKGWFGMLVTLVCLSLSIFIFGKYTLPQFKKPMISSEDGYARMASGVTQAMVMIQDRDYIWPPLTKIAYSLPVIYFPQNQFISVRVFAWLLIIGTSVLTGLITLRLTNSHLVGILAFSLALINPINIVLSTQTLSENIWVFTVGMSLWLLMSGRKTDWYYGFLFWSLSQACRYESWYLTPLAITFFWFLHRQKKQTIIFIISSFIFPIFWLVMTYIDTKNIHTYLDEKLNQAKSGPPDVYHHFFKSLEVWLRQINNSFHPATITLFLLGSVFYIRQKNLLSAFALFIFFSLVFQVYIATMEYFPLRYLVILPLTVFPPLLHFIHSRKIPHTAKYLLILVLMLINLPTLHTKIAKNTEYIYPELIEVGQFLKSSGSPCVTYLKAKTSHINDYSAFWYFSNTPVDSINFMRVSNPFVFDYQLKSSCFTIVAEKTKGIPGPNDNLPPFFGPPIYENPLFRVYEPKPMKEYVQSQI